MEQPVSSVSVTYVSPTGEKFSLGFRLEGDQACNKKHVDTLFESIKMKLKEEGLT